MSITLFPRKIMIVVEDIQVVIHNVEECNMITFKHKYKPMFIVVVGEEGEEGEEKEAVERKRLDHEGTEGLYYEVFADPFRENYCFQS